MIPFVLRLCTRILRPMSVLHVDVRDRIARLTLNRPDTGNALDLELTTALHQAAEGLCGSGVGAVIVSGAGKTFCVGADPSTCATPVTSARPCSLTSAEAASRALLNTSPDATSVL
jgi:enoyl-CoA hydratase/carnithine racemase